MKILLIEDDKKIVGFVKKGLQSEGYAVDVAYDGEEGFYKAKEGTYDLMVLDIILPILDGITLCKQLRSQKNTVPIIMLTAKDTTEDRIQGLDAGADDYLTKPFSFAELLARIRALTRRYKGISSEALVLGDLSLDPEAYEVKRAGKEINLSATEFKLLRYFMQNPNRVLSKTLILENIWGYDFDPESNIVEVYIKYLRDKIDKGFKKSLIQTIHGVGYKICD